MTKFQLFLWVFEDHFNRMEVCLNLIVVLLAFKVCVDLCKLLILWRRK